MTRHRPALRRLRRGAAALAASERGLGAVEFAMAAPFLALLFLGGYQLMDAIAAHRKVTTTARTMADITSQATSLTESEVEANMGAARAVLAPYNVANATTRISQIYIRDNERPRVEWSVASDGDELKNSDMNGNNPSVAVPDDIRTPRTYLILSEIKYRYDPVAGRRFIGTLNFTDKIFMGPRRSDAVACPDCP